MPIGFRPRFGCSSGSQPSYHRRFAVAVLRRYTNGAGGWISYGLAQGDVASSWPIAAEPSTTGSGVCCSSVHVAHALPRTLPWPLRVRSRRLPAMLFTTRLHRPRCRLAMSFPAHHRTCGLTPMKSEKLSCTRLPIPRRRCLRRKKKTRATRVCCQRRLRRKAQHHIWLAAGARLWIALDGGKW